MLCLIFQLEDESSESGSESGDEKASTKKYQPPKLAAVHYGEPFLLILQIDILY